MICLLLVVIGALLLSYYFSESRRIDLMQSQMAQAQATIGSFNAVIWQRHNAALLTPAPAIGQPVNPQTQQLVANFKTEARRFFSAQNYSKITIFSPDVKKLHYGSTTAYATTNDGTRVTLFDLSRAQTGQAVNRVLNDAYMKESEAPQQSRVLIQMIVPLLKAGTATPEALAEVFVDISAQWHKLRMMQLLIIAGMVGIFGLMVTLLIFTARRAETIITKQHEVNLELTATAAQAEAQSHDKSQFLASVSHELRTPLNAIIGFSDIIRKEAKASLDKVYQDYIDDINASGRHLLSLINDILDFSKAEAGKLQIDWGETDVTKVIRNSLRMVLPRAESAQVTLVEDMPSHHLVVVTDAKKMKQVLLNLLSNAVKFTKPGGEVRCQAWSDVANGALVVAVKDTGIGIAPKDISKVMTPFGQVDSALSRKYEGTGLGLPLTKKFVESMGGKFEITSELDVGTTITITIPNAPPGWSQPTSPVMVPVAEEDNHVA